MSRLSISLHPHWVCANLHKTHHQVRENGGLMHELSTGDLCHSIQGSKPFYMFDAFIINFLTIVFYFICYKGSKKKRFYFKMSALCWSALPSSQVLDTVNILCFPTAKLRILNILLVSYYIHSILGKLHVHVCNFTDNYQCLPLYYEDLGFEINLINIHLQWKSYSNTFLLLLYKNEHKIYILILVRYLYVDLLKQIISSLTISIGKYLNA